MMRLKKWILFAVIALIATGRCCAESDNDIKIATENGLRYLESVQSEYGEFPTYFMLDKPEPERSLQAVYDSNLFATAMVADLLQTINSPRVERIQKKVTAYLQSQLINKKGLWSYVTTHTKSPVYLNTEYDLDDTCRASMVLQQQRISFPDNRVLIKANKNKDGLYLTFVPPTNQFNGVDCVVNANVLSYLHENDPKVCHYINEQIAQEKKCAYFYTRQNTNYFVARAYASGVTCLKPAITHIANYTLTQFNQKNGSVNNSPQQTAIALNTLLASGYRGEIIKQAKQYLLATQSTINGSWPAEDIWIWASPQAVGKAKSTALTSAMALKALNTFPS